MYCCNRKRCIKWFAGNRHMDTDPDSGRKYHYRNRNKYNYFRTIPGNLYIYCNQCSRMYLSPSSANIVINAQPATPAAPISWNNHTTHMFSFDRQRCIKWFAGNRDMDIDPDSGRNYHYRDRNKYNHFRTMPRALYIYCNQCSRMYLSLIRKYCNKCPASNTCSSLCWNNHATNMFSRDRKRCIKWFAGKQAHGL